MIATLFQLFGVVSLAVLILTSCSRYFIRVAVRLLTRQEQRFTAARCGLRDGVEGYQRALRHERKAVEFGDGLSEYARLENTVMER